MWQVYVNEKKNHISMCRVKKLNTINDYLLVIRNETDAVYLFNNSLFEMIKRAMGIYVGIPQDSRSTQFMCEKKIDDNLRQLHYYSYI